MRAVSFFTVTRLLAVASYDLSFCRHRAPQMLFSGLFGRGSDVDQAQGDRKAEQLGVQLPNYRVIRQGEDWEVRKYQTLSIVECEYESRPEGYELLGGYAQRGENAANAVMPPTAPCVMQPLGSPKKMWFILPSPHTPRDSSIGMIPPPMPADPATLECKVIKSLCVAVGKFSGYAVPDVVLKRRDSLLQSLSQECIESLPGAPDHGLMLAQYNELFSLPWLRDNEVWIEVREESC